MVNMDQLWPALVAIYNENPWKFMSDGRAVYYGEQYGWKTIAKHVLQKRARDMGQVSCLTSVSLSIPRYA